MQSLWSWPPPAPPPATHRSTWGVLAPLVHAQGISEHEDAVRDTVLRLIPPSLEPIVDSHGNVIVRWGSGKPRRAFMAHMDEIGYRVTGVDLDGRLRVEKKGGFYDWLYEGEIVRRGDGKLAVVAPRADYLARPRPTIDSPLSDRHRLTPSGFKGLPDSLVRVDPGNYLTGSADWMGAQITVVKSLARLGAHRVAGRSLDDRFGCTALILALRELSHSAAPKDGSVLFAFTVEEETGLRGSEKLSDDLLAAGELPPVVHAVDTFVSSDTPLEDPRYGHALLGQGCVIRAVDTGSAAPKAAVDAVRRVAARRSIALQFGVTSGGNDGQPFAARGSLNVPLGWPLRYSHTQVETADLRDLEALAALVTELARIPPGSE
jgi:putative aminopeptidase FrvX